MSAELLICILTSERPLDGSLSGVTSLLPRVNLALQKVAVFNAPLQALTAEDADFDLRHVQPTRVLGCVVELHLMLPLFFGVLSSLLTRSFCAVPRTSVARIAWD